MIDQDTEKPVRVSIDGDSGPFILVSIKSMDRVIDVLKQNHIPHWLDPLIISVDNKPAVAVINIGRGSDPHHVQTILDEAA
jgi:hypothetical protein